MRMKIAATFADKPPQTVDKIQRLKITLPGSVEIELVPAGNGAVQIRTNNLGEFLSIEPGASNVIILRSREAR